MRRRDAGTRGGCATSIARCGRNGRRPAPAATSRSNSTTLKPRATGCSAMTVRSGRSIRPSSPRLPRGRRSRRGSGLVPSFTYQNPIDFSYPYFDGTERKRHGAPRPSHHPRRRLYYLTFTAFPFTHSDSRNGKIDYNSSPGIMLFSSPDLKQWKFENWLVKSSDSPGELPLQASLLGTGDPQDRWQVLPDLHRRQLDQGRVQPWRQIGAYVAFVGVADKVTGPYGTLPGSKAAGCDTTLFGDDNGKTYAIMPFGDEFIQEVDLTGIEQGDIKLVGPRRVIVSRDNSDVGRRTSPDYLEGPWMIKQKGKYILFTAAPYRNKIRPVHIGPRRPWRKATGSARRWPTTSGDRIGSNRRCSWPRTHRRLPRPGRQ